MLGVEEVLRWQAAWFACYVKVEILSSFNTVFMCEFRVMYIVFRVMVLGVSRSFMWFLYTTACLNIVPEKADQQQIKQQI